MYHLLLIIAILPVILLGAYIYSKDRHKEPKLLLIKLFAAGIFSCFLVLILTYILVFFMPFLTKEYTTMNFIEFTIYIFISIALVEEFCKWLMTYHFGYKNKEFDEVYDITVYSVFVALGFAAFENILYVFNIASIQVGILRGLLAIPGHVCDGVAMGYYLSLAKYHEKMGNQKEVKINKIPGKEWILIFILASVVTYIFYFILKYFNTANLLPSTVSVTTSFIAVYLTFRRSAFYALGYALNDLVLIILWTMAAFTDISYISVLICFAAFFINDLYGFANWSRMQKRQT